MIFICGLKNPEVVDVRTIILMSIEQERNMTLQMVTVERQRLLHFKHDTALVQLSDFKLVNPIKSSKPSKQNTASAQQPAGKPSPCWFC